MTTANPSLIAEACAALAVSDVVGIGAPGGQKVVRHVRRGAADLVLKVITIRSRSRTVSPPPMPQVSSTATSARTMSESSRPVFEVGILMYAALTGELPIPYTGDDVDYVARLSKVQIIDIATKRPDLDADQLAIIRRALHPQPARRFLNGRKLADALEPLQ